MAKPRPGKRAKARARAASLTPGTVRLLPMQLKIGDRLSDETGEWEVVSRPYTSPGGKSTHAHVKRVGQAGESEVRTWGAFQHIEVKRA
jgi:hypothetical protein